MDKIAFLFAGQGKEYTDLGRYLYNFNNKSCMLFSKLSRDCPNLIGLCTGQIEDIELNNMQPCIFAIETVISEILRDSGIIPDMVAGFSFGEIPALVFCGCLNMNDGIAFAKERAKACELTESNVEVFALINANDIIRKMLSNYKNIYVSSYNTLNQVTISGDRREINEFRESIKGENCKMVKVNVKRAFHTPYMLPAVEKLKIEIDKLNCYSMQIPVFSNYTGEIYDKNIQGLLLNHLIYPVKWQIIIENMIKSGVNHFIEIGPGKVLSGMMKNIPGISISNTSNKDNINEILNRRF